MRLLKASNRFVLFVTILFFFVAGLQFLIFFPKSTNVFNSQTENWEEIIDAIFSLRNECILQQDTETLKTIFLTNEKNGRWAYDFEVQRATYLNNWALKQGVKVTAINSTIKIKSIKKVGRGYALYVMTSNEYKYVYMDEPEAENSFRLGAYHSVDIIPKEKNDGWIISREWYDDPLLDTINMTHVSDEMTAYITAHPQTDISNISSPRVAAVAYAYQYCGAADDGKNNFSYNSEYSNYNALGGDCANFASQALFEGGFKKNSTWNYTGGKGSRAWVNAQALKNYLLNSGRASLLAAGSYKEIYQYAYSLRPGDIVAYVKKGKVAHVSVVTGVDSKGYPLVSCHNLDRCDVPWDIGWSGDSIKFALLNVSY